MLQSIVPVFEDEMEDDPESPLGLAQGNNLVFYISRKHSLATRVDDVPLPTAPLPKLNRE
jgi:hypothetical protein